MRGRWYGNVMGVDPLGVAQVDHHLNRVSSIYLSEHVLRLAQAEYEHQYGTQQDYERMQERHGLSVLEVVGLLADLAERHGAKPTQPRAAEQSDPAG